MSIWRMILREVQYRRLNFVLSLVAVAMAVASIVAADIVVRRDQAVTEMILTEKQQAVAAGVARRQNEVEQAGAALQDVMRRTMRELGFNILILPSDQDLSELHLNGTLSRTMPEEYVNRLAKSGIVTVNHLLPSVTRRIRWEEQQMDIILQGTRGEVPLMHSSDKKPLLNAVSPGQIVVGYGIHSRLKLKVDDRVTLMGQEFTVSTLHPERGSSDDVTVWIDLGQAQQLLGMQNLIHAILALECECAGDRISQIRAEISQILPGTQVIERYSQALTRAEARGKAKLAAEESLQKEKEAGAAAIERELNSRVALQQRHQEFIGIIVPVIAGAGAIWAGILALLNARQRTTEIGILRAIGLKTSQMFLILLSRALLTGTAGAVLGFLAGQISASFWNEAVPASLSLDIREASDSVRLLGLSFLIGPVLSLVVTWLPAVVTIRRDPALVLQAEL